VAGERRGLKKGNNKITPAVAHKSNRKEKGPPLRGGTCHWEAGLLIQVQRKDLDRPQDHLSENSQTACTQEVESSPAGVGAG